MSKDIGEFKKHIDELNDDINNIDRVILRELEKLKPFYKDRMLKIE